MARISYTSSNDINVLRKVKYNLSIIKRKIDTIDNYLDKDNLINQTKNLNISLFILCNLAKRRPVIFRDSDIEELNTYELLTNEMIGENEVDEENVKKINKLILNMLREKEKMYQRIYRC